MLTAVSADGGTATDSTTHSSGQESDSLINSTETVAEDLVVADQSQDLVNSSSGGNNCSNSTNDTNNNQIVSSNDHRLDTSSTTTANVGLISDNSHQTTTDLDDNLDDHRLDNTNGNETVITECDNTSNAPTSGPGPQSGGIHMALPGPQGLLDYHQPHDAPDTKEGIEELCPVCGDKVSGYHYGLLTCESCKGFFKRTVQNKKVYTCVADRSCHIDKSQRKRCPFCRFQKCLDVGMKLEAVRADRMRGGRNKFGPMYKRDRARRLQLMRQKQMTRPQCQQPPAIGGPPGEVAIGGPHGSHFLAALHGHGMPTTAHIYSADGIKQELIQIPQLSSSTSSPDSSPSPGQHSVAGQSQSGPHPFGGPVPGLAHGQNAGHGSGPTQTIHSPVAASELIKWVAAGPPPGASAGSTAGTPTTALSPKNGAHFHFESGAPSTATSQALVPIQLTTSGGSGGKIPALIREFQLSAPDDKDWQSQLFGLLQNQTYNQCEVDLFELMCKVIDQSLFAQVDWARNSIFFKDLKVDDQMKLLQHAWSDMLVLDHIHQRLHVGLPDETTLPNGQKFDLLCLALLGVPSVADQLHQVTQRLTELKFDSIDYLCLKFLLLLNPGMNHDVRGLSNFKLVQEAHEQTQQALLEYTINCYPQITDKFGQLMAQVPEMRALTMRGEEFLYYKHMSGSAPTQTLLMEMLHAKKK